MTTDILRPLDDDNSGQNPPFTAPVSLEDLADPYADNDADTDEDSKSSEDEDGKPSRRKSSRVKVTPAVVRRVIERHEALASANDEQRNLLAAALAVKSDTTELTVASLTAGRNSLSAVAELLDLADAGSPFTAMVSALAFDRETARRIWQLLSAVEAVDGALPAKNDVAAAKLAEAAMGLNEHQKAALVAVKELVG